MKANDKYQSFLPWQNRPLDATREYGPDDRSGAVYLEDEKLRFVTEVAIVTQRPLLLRGEPGSGKSSFAAFVARNLEWRYYEHTVTARTEAKDLLWRFDALRRLRDARREKEPEGVSARRYVTPGPLWWAFNREEALNLLNNIKRKAAQVAMKSVEPYVELNKSRDPLRAVVLIDEIDKADPNVPNDLLEVLGTNRFHVEDADILVTRHRVGQATGTLSANQYGSLLTVITTNEERDLPVAFLRRCVVHTIAEPEEPGKRTPRLVDIARLHMGPLIAKRARGSDMVEQIAVKCVQLRDDAKRKQRRGPSVAEFLDAVRFCLVRNVGIEAEEWKMVQESVLQK